MKNTAHININLLPKDPFFSTVFGKILKWALSAGRYVVIFTELVVIMSFIARFTLDRQVTDLNSSIDKKKQIILSYGNLESDFKTIQEKIVQYKQTEQETTIVDSFESLSAVIPEGIILKELAIRPTSVTISGNTFSQSSFNLLVNNLQLSTDFVNINVGEIQSSEEDKGSIDFSIKADTKVIQKVKANAKTPEKVDLLDRTQGL
jgi:Tfp pilus assembly protein PilN